ncbi:MAG: GNAT family N-acetyltransferase [Candidatus Methanomethylophilaceae archaeon]|jgi:L-amino acid N-acyltransferase YncA|nr:GNAT family N-acetyltransferase [Candidatus Methanomethylophilaceae archaeon]MDD2779448.1 GNAT family N-acetyltransferase [Candidatus Methanomethylophilaceae archaeon]MDD3128238.1 GNAT family N-acetyltransferase [Candidatus Methanomethylophilaceae archaeon]MDD4119632.1 GNAT family N-acetyltransferase [Candidatus Methanomethylophilaceae archaeon]MDD4453960.1 GNAT family N-acetyltransferase [Candidatus Methanomethylophilaceae archaeon]
MEIRPLKLRDLENVRKLEISCIREYFSEILENKWEDLPQEWKDNLGSTSKKAFKTYLSSGLSFVAEEDGEVVGFIFAQMLHNVYDAENMVWIDNMGVHSYFRRLGIGYKLLKAVMDEGHKQGANIVHSAIQPQNKPSIMLHKKLGFFMDRREIALFDMNDYNKKKAP